MGPDLAAVSDMCSQLAAKGLRVEMANHNSHSQFVFAGTPAAIAALIELAEEADADCVPFSMIPMMVDGPFHSSFMKEAAEALRQDLAPCAFKATAWPVVANVTVKPYGHDDNPRDLLARQIQACVRWQETIDAMESAGVDTLVEMGHGVVLKTIYQTDNRNRKLPFKELKLVPA
jgi:[acyl-carrier-protein] S-malonyltransferase